MTDYYPTGFTTSTLSIEDWGTNSGKRPSSALSSISRQQTTKRPHHNQNDAAEHHGNEAIETHDTMLQLISTQRTPEIPARDPQQVCEATASNNQSTPLSEGECRRHDLEKLFELHTDAPGLPTSPLSDLESFINLDQGEEEEEAPETCFSSDKSFRLHTYSNAKNEAAAQPEPQDVQTGLKPTYVPHQIEELPEVQSLWEAWKSKEAPTCPAQEVDDLPDPEHSDMLNPRTLKWRILGPKPKQKEQPQLKLQIRQQLRQHGITDVEETTIAFSTGRISYIIAGFNTDSQYETAKNVTIQLGPVQCRLVAGCPGWAANYEIIKTSGHCPRTEQGALLNQIYETVDDVIEPSHIFMQAAQTRTKDARGAITLGKHHFSGTVWVLGNLRKGKKLKDLPAFVSTPGAPVAPLFFKGRGYACLNCPMARPSHQTPDCPKRPCSQCHRKGHREDTCPQNEKKRSIEFNKIHFGITK